MTSSTVSLPRAKSAFISAAALRSLIKRNLGFNARQVTVSQDGSARWLTVTVRDAAVDLKAVKLFADKFDTMVSSQDDSFRGQSVNVATTGQVDAAHAAPFLAEVKAAISHIIRTGETVELSTGAVLRREDGSRGDFFVSRFLTGTRGCYIRDFDVIRGEAWTVTALALQTSRL